MRIPPGCDVMCDRAMRCSHRTDPHHNCVVVLDADAVICSSLFSCPLRSLCRPPSFAALSSSGHRQEAASDEFSSHLMSDHDAVDAHTYSRRHALLRAAALRPICLVLTGCSLCASLPPPPLCRSPPPCASSLRLCVLGRQSMRMESSSSGSGGGAEHLKGIPVRAYLDQTVVPLLMQGMSELVKVRCAHPTHSTTPRTAPHHCHARAGCAMVSSPGFSTSSPLWLQAGQPGGLAGQLPPAEQPQQEEMSRSHAAKEHSAILSSTSTAHRLLYCSGTAVAGLTAAAAALRWVGCHSLGEVRLST